MGIIRDKISRLSHKALSRVKTFFVHARGGIITVLVCGVLASPLIFMETGSFAYCTKNLVSCLEEKSVEKNGISKGLSVMHCALKTVWCDLETVWFFLTDTATAEKTKLLDEPFENAADELKTDSKYAPASDGVSLPDIPAEEEMSGPELKKEMERLRAEREVFEKNQIEMRKNIFETLESQKKPDILTGNTAQEGL